MDARTHGVSLPRSLRDVLVVLPAGRLRHQGLDGLMTSSSKGRLATLWLGPVAASDSLGPTGRPTCCLHLIAPALPVGGASCRWAFAQGWQVPGPVASTCSFHPLIVQLLRREIVSRIGGELARSLSGWEIAYIRGFANHANQKIAEVYNKALVKLGKKPEHTGLLHSLKHIDPNPPKPAPINADVVELKAAEPTAPKDTQDASTVKDAAKIEPATDTRADAKAQEARLDAKTEAKPVTTDKPSAK